jgi:hypothetical protein
MTESSLAGGRGRLFLITSSRSLKSWRKRYLVPAGVCRPPDLDPDEERQEPDARSGLELASLGVELALKKKNEFQLERQVIIEERDANLIQPHIAAKRLRDTRLPERIWAASFSPADLGVPSYGKP